MPAASIASEIGLENSGRLELHGGHVDRHFDVRRPFGGLPARLMQNPFPDRHDQTVLFGHRDELAGRHIAAFGMPPTQKRLERIHPPVGRRDDRLKMEFELLLGERDPQIVLHLAARANLFVHRRLEEAVAAAVRLGVVKRHVGVADQFVAVDAVVRRQRNADAGADFDVVAVDRIGSADRGDQPFRETRGVARDVRDALDDGELVAAEPGDRVAFAGDRFDLRGDFPQQLVAKRVPEGVVDHFEMIQVEVEHGVFGDAAPRLRETLFEALLELDAVRQSGQGVAPSPFP